MKIKIVRTSCILLLISLAAAAGCGGNKQPPEEITASVLMERLAAAHAESTTYQYDMDGSVSLSGDAPASSLEAYESTYRRSAAVDNDRAIGWLDIVMEMASLSQVTDSGSIEVEMYFSGDWMYMAQITDGEAEQWVKSELQSGYWQEVDIVHQPLARLEDSEITITGYEEVDGTDCYVAAAEADAAAVWEVMIVQLPVDQDIINAAVPEDMVGEVTATWWIDGDTFRLKQERLRMVLVMTSADLGIDEDAGSGIEIALELTTVFYDYGKSVSIEIPAEALDAPESS